MASGILGAFVRHRNAANLFMLLLIIFGAWGVSKLNRQLMPSLEIHNINISVVWSGATAADIEKNILQAVEPAVRYLDGVQTITSRAAEGSGSITLSFARNTDMQEAEARVDGAVQSVLNLPEGADDLKVTALQFFDPVASVGISGPFPEATLRRYAREIRDGLLAAGVDRVRMVGYRDREIAIEVGEARLRQLGLTLADISSVVNAGITDQPAGALEGDFDARIRAVAAGLSAPELAAIQIRNSAQGNVIYLGDIATVTDTFDNNDTLGFMRGVPAIRLMISRTAAADTITAFEAIKTYVADISPTLPPSLNIVVFDAAASLVDDRLSLLITNGATGLVIVLFVLFLFLEPRVAFWVAAGIPISVLATLGVMYLTGQTINMISMFALLMTLGIIVDDAIVVGEHTATRYAAGDTPAVAATRGASRMATPVIAASLTTMAAFGPILLVGDVIGQIMAALPLVVMAVLLASALECFFILPGHLAHSLPKQRRRPGWFRRRFDAGFAWFREHVVGALSDLSYHWRYATVALAVALAILSGSLLASSQLRFQFFLSAEGESFNIFAAFQPGIPQEQMRAIIVRIEQAVTEVENELAPPGEDLVLTTYATLDLENSGAFISPPPNSVRCVPPPLPTRSARRSPRWPGWNA
ncbi:MAG: efflux RND transporter permease subunit [Alphaproteobacteria bacterium]|nr:efflux RND transporter permease subunit [Alphaproteobacteria bacterium]